MTDADEAAERQESLRREAWKWILHMTSGDATKGDIAALKRWRAESPRHAEAFARASGAWRTFGSAAESVARRNGLPPIKRAFGPGRAVTRRTVLGGAAVASAAAATVVIASPPLGLWPSFDELMAQYRTATGEQRRIALSGSGSVEMNTRTSLDLRPATARGDRIELIAGEAAFATGSRPVEVIAASGRASADDAQFNMRRDGAAVCVTCLVGIVQIEQRSQSATLQQKQQVSYSENGLGSIATIDAALATGWREGDLFFQDELLSRVIDELNRYRPGRIILMNQSLGRRRITAHFRLERIGVIVTQLQETFGVRVTSLPGGVVLVS